MSNYRRGRRPKRTPDMAALLALIAILLAGVTMITVARLSPAGLATVTTALGALYIAWRSQAR